MKIRRQQFLLLLITTVFLTFSLSIFIYFSQKKTLISNIYNHLESISKAKEIRIHGMIETRYEMISFPANNHIIKENLFKNLSRPKEEYRKRIDSTLKKYTSRIPSFKKMFVLDPKGIIQASSHPGYVYQDWSDHEAFVVSVKGKKYLDGFHFDEKGVLSVFLSSPILFNDSNEVAGVLIIERDASDILTVTEDYVGLGETGETLLGKKYPGKILYLTPLRHNRTAALKRAIELTNRDIAMGMVLNEKKHILTETMDYREKKCLFPEDTLRSLNGH
jgi:hypothetical protein